MVFKMSMIIKINDFITDIFFLLIINALLQFSRTLIGFEITVLAILSVLVLRNHTK
jgi:hypothetical protein